MTDNTYQGWTNYETWAVNLWMDNEESSYRFWQGIIAKLDDENKEQTLSDIIESHHKLNMNAYQTNGVYADLMSGEKGKPTEALKRMLKQVNWLEIAGSQLEE